MNRLTRINIILEKQMPLIAPFSLLLGVAFAPFFIHLQLFVPWLFALMTFSGSLGAGFRDMKKAIQSPVPLFCTLFLLHVWMPLTALAAGRLLFGSNPHLVTGMVLEFTIPTSVVCIIWVSIYRGNAALSLSVLLIDTLLSPILTPLSLKLYLGSSTAIAPLDMIRDLLLMVAFPTLLAMSLNQYTKGEIKNTLSPKLAPFSKISLMLVVIINSSKAAPLFKAVTLKLFAVAITMLILAASGFVFGITAAKILKQKQAETVSLAFGSGMRNISAGAVIAAQYFPAEVLFPVMICTVFQQILAALTGFILRKIEEKSHQVV